MRCSPRGFRFVVLVAASLLLPAGSALAQVPACTPPPPGMVAWWPGDGNASDIAGVHHGSVVGGVTYAAGRVGQAFRLDGSTGWVQVPDSAALSVTGQITIDAWINPATTGGRVVDKITAGGADGYLLDTHGGVVRLIVDGQSVSGATTLPTGAWSHVAGVYDGAEMRVYLNGTLDGSLGTTVAIPVNALSVRIGAASDGGSLFNGLIDEVEVFGRALSQPEIQAIVAAGSAGKCKQAATAEVPAVSIRGLSALALLLAAGALRVLRLHPV
ncbi:MAG: LamG domain-containing protein [Holophagales bacterium]|nr:LamG domain-containing protein [Holophagales bacterium]